MASKTEDKNIKILAKTEKMQSTKNRTFNFRVITSLENRLEESENKLRKVIHAKDVDHLVDTINTSKETKKVTANSIFSLWRDLIIRSSSVNRQMKHEVDSLKWDIEQDQSNNKDVINISSERVAKIFNRERESVEENHNDNKILSAIDEGTSLSVLTFLPSE